MFLHRRFILGFAAPVCLFPGRPAEAQSSTSIIGGGAAYESYNFRHAEATGIKSLALFTVTFAGRVSLSRALAIELSGNFARCELIRSDGSTATLSGVTNTDVALTATIVPERLHVGVIADLPTGKQKQNEDQAQVAGAVAADLLALHI